MVEPAVNALKQGADVDEAAELLLDALPLMDDSQLAEALANAMFVADLWGQIASQRGVDE